MNWFLYRLIKTNRTIASYRRYYCLSSLNRNLRLLSSLVFTFTTFEVGLFQGPERQCQSFEKVQVRKIFQGLTPHPQNLQLNVASLHEEQRAVFKSLFRTLLNHTVNQAIFLVWVFFHEHPRFNGQQEKGKAIPLTPLYHFHPLHRHFDRGRAITAESSTLHIASIWIRTGNLWFPNASL